jgi:hypothetical protein
MTARLPLLADFLAGRDDPEAIESLRDALRRWCASDGAIPLHRYLGLQSPQAFRRQERDRWLREAARHTADTAALVLAIRRFERVGWRDAAVAPAAASEVEHALHHARAAGLALPRSAKHLARIVDTDSPKRVQRLAA